MNALNVLMWLNLGLIAGWIAGQVMRPGGYSAYGTVVVSLAGMLGAFVGGWAGSALLGSDTAGFDLLTAVPALPGAIVLTTALWSLLPGRRAA